MAESLALQTVLDGLGHGVLIFASDGKLRHSNTMAGTILGADLNIIRKEGWSVAAELFDTSSNPLDLRMDAVRDKALKSERPVRFKIFRSGAYVPCWAAALTTSDGDINLMLTLDMADWNIVTHVIERFSKEMQETVDSTLGHINLIERTITNDSDDEAVKKVAKRIGGFTRLIAIHMARSARLMTMLERLQDLRTGRIQDVIRAKRQKISLEDFIEDFIEELEEIQFLDPESETHDYRSRFKVEMDSGLYLNAVPTYLGYTIQEILRNAIMYSMVGTPIVIQAQTMRNQIQIDIIDEGYGIREREYQRIFEPFARARQPQVIAEFGYGLALHLCKNEIEAMGGKLWFTSEDGVGTRFYIMLPQWKDIQPEPDTAESSSSANTT